jgi:Animal haem peroxidase
MKLPRTQRDIPLDETDRKCPAYVNTNTAWWDASQLYGSSEAVTTELRGNAIDGKLKLTEKGTEAFLPRDTSGLPMTGFNSNWWIGLELLHTLFALEHNAICDVLHTKYPEWSRYVQKAPN